MMHILSMQEITLIEEIWRVIVDKFYTAELGYYENINIDPESAITPATIVFAIFIAAMTASSIAIFNKRVLGRLIRRLIQRGGVGCDNAMTLSELGLEKSRAIKLFINRYALMRAVRCREEDEFYGIDAHECDESEPSFEVENTEEIKVPFWRRILKKKTNRNDETPDDTTVLENSNSVAFDSDATSHSNNEGANATQHIEDDLVIEDSYAASLVAKKKYKRTCTDHFYIRPSQRHRLAVRYDKKGTNPMVLILIAAVCLIGGSLAIKALPWILETLDGLLGSLNTTNVK